MNKRKWQWNLYAFAFAVIFSACAVEEDPCVNENTGYIVAVNMTQGIEAEGMKVYIDGQYKGDVPPGGESPRIALPAGKTYEVQGKTQSGAVQIKDIELGKCEEVGVRLLAGKE